MRGAPCCAVHFKRHNAGSGVKGYSPLGTVGEARRSSLNPDNSTPHRSVWCRLGYHVEEQLLWGSCGISNCWVHCISLGGSLASVHNSYANHFVTNLIKSQDSTGPPTWLGGSNCQQTSSWLWTDGSPWDFTKWHWGEPNNFGGTENCIHINYAGKPCVLF
uniref:C-type lectin domain-containing protein n=1 Tax=Erpetoichthys calabaricus TaxID=27687 RepID=A0A8C4T625_ERPCA